MYIYICIYMIIHTITYVYFKSSNSISAAFHVPQSRPPPC